MAANVTFVLDSDEAKAVQGFLKVVDAQKKTEHQTRRGGQAFKDSFGPQAISQLKSFAAGFVSVGAAIGVVTTAMREMQRIREEAGRSVVEAAAPTGRLAQLAAGDRQRLAELRRLQDQFQLSAAAGTRGEAGQQVFSIISAGEEANLELFRRVGASKLETDVVGLAQATGGLKLTFGTAETGSTKQIINKALLASQISRTGLAETLQATARTGQFARLAGVSDEEAFAATAAALSALGPGEGETQIRAFMKFVAENPKFQGKGLVGAAEQIQGMGLAPNKLARMIGEVRAIGGYNIVAQNAALIRSKAGELQALQGGDTLERSMALNLRDPELRAVIESQRATAREDVGKRALGIESQVADAIYAELDARARARGAGEFGNAMTNFASRTDRFLSGDREFIDQNLILLGPGETRDELLRSVEAADEMRKAALEVHNAARNLNAASRGGRNAQTE